MISILGSGVYFRAELYSKTSTGVWKGMVYLVWELGSALGNGRKAFGQSLLNTGDNTMYKFVSPIEFSLIIVPFTLTLLANAYLGCHTVISE